MEAKELRIGNYFRFISTKNERKVENIETFDCAEVNINNVSISDIEPVELTKEWLLKFGFIKNVRIDCGGYKRTDVWSKYSFSITMWEDGKLFYDWIGGNIEVKSVSQLQNLFFALTGNELLIKN